jgi:hypothetical protein
MFQTKISEYNMQRNVHHEQHFLVFIVLFVNLIKFYFRVQEDCMNTILHLSAYIYHPILKWNPDYYF